MLKSNDYMIFHMFFSFKYLYVPFLKDIKKDKACKVLTLWPKATNFQLLDWTPSASHQISLPSAARSIPKFPNDFSARPFWSCSRWFDPARSSRTAGPSAAHTWSVRIPLPLSWTRRQIPFLCSCPCDPVPSTNTSHWHRSGSNLRLRILVRLLRGHWGQFRRCSRLFACLWCAMDPPHYKT